MERFEDGNEISESLKLFMLNSLSELLYQV